jgi:hypothetical protein
LRALEVSSEKVDLAMEAAAMKARAEALFAVLEGVVAHRMALEEKLATLPHGPLKAMLAHQIDCVQAQQVSILVRSGMSTADAAAVFAPPSVAALPEPKPGKVSVRAHQRGKPGVESLNGIGTEN